MKVAKEAAIIIIAQLNKHIEPLDLPKPAATVLSVPEGL